MTPDRLQGVDSASIPRPLGHRLPGWLLNIPFLALHVGCLAVIFTGADVQSLALCLGLYFIRMFGITAGYHRYFAHRSYKTSRWFQFVMAWLGCSALQKGPLWWVSHHRQHHLHSDTDQDPHSPLVWTLWWSHIGWVLSPEHAQTRWDSIRDWRRYPELRWLNRFHWVPGLALAVGCFLIDGWRGLVWGLCISTVLLYHATFTVNSLCHLFGRRRFQTKDDSRNNLLVALFTLGEGWHNNHHHYQSSANQGFFWWEIDISYYMIRLLQVFGIVWGIRIPPRSKSRPPRLRSASQAVASPPAP